MKIKNKKLFKKQVVTIVIGIVSIIVTILVANYLREKGLSVFFTTNVYKEAFEKNPADIKLINRMELAIIICILAIVPQELKYNKELRKLEREEERLCGLS